MAVWIVLLLVGTAHTACACEPQPDGSCHYVRPTRLAVKPKPLPAPAPLRVPDPVADPVAGILPFTYAYVFTGPVSLYSGTEAIAAGVVTTSLASGYVWVRVTGATVVDGQKYYRIENGLYVPASVVTFVRPSAFEGAINPELPAAWILFGGKLSASAGAPPDENAPSVSRYQLVHVYEEQQAGEQVWYRVGDNQWIGQKQVGLIRASARPPEIPPGDKWIEINLFEQTLMAYEGERVVYATLVSSGLPAWPTVTGLFRVWSKVRYGTMYGAEGKADYYYLESVPWAVYFQDDFAIHAAYWHDRFGYPHSHGCVNVPPVPARWLFEWATPVLPEGVNVALSKDDNPGVWVWVHE